ncbi:hypothetical protein LCGC14_0846700 [marine sediment metagenome]|uniref:Uncharacterized protein n=1 Tax=marine sediment metagenome TaxID=412755 RepID=A0A0F9PWV5_9ZZZZ
MRNNNGFRLSTAEFKGRVLESLDNIKSDIKEIKVSNSNQHRDFYKRIGSLERQPSFSISPVAWFLSLIGIGK